MENTIDTDIVNMRLRCLELGRSTSIEATIAQAKQLEEYVMGSKPIHNIGFIHKTDIVTIPKKRGRKPKQTIA